MRFLLSEHHWALDSLFPGEWEWMRRLPHLAAGEDLGPRALDRLYPSPLASDVLADEGTLAQIEDWDELIRPELAQSFAAARAVVEADLARGETLAPGSFDEDDPLLEEFENAGFPYELPPLHRVLVPYEHTEAWYSTLNQARLLMNEEYQLAASEDRHLAKSLGAEVGGQDRLLLIAQYEMYSVVQSILVDNVMQG